MSKSAEFRKLLASEPYVFTTGMFTPLQAKIAQAVGLKCVYMSGLSSALGHLGRADLGFPTMTEMTGWARNMVSATDLPVISDADDGYGNALITQRTVQEYERTGVAGIHIEDQRLPKRCGHLAGKYCIPVEEAVLKIKAAVEAKSDPDFFIIARTDAVSAVGGSLEEAVDRGKRYADAGADMVWSEFPGTDLADAEVFAREIRGSFPDTPMAFNYSSSLTWSVLENPPSFKDLADMGYKFIFISLGAIHAAMYAEWDFLKDLADNQEQAQLRLEGLTKGHPTENHHTMGDFEHYQKLEERYLPQEMVRERYSTTEGFGARR